MAPSGRGGGWRRLAVAALILGCALRLGLAAVNLQANDNHAEVIKVIADEGHFPKLHEMWEGHQPKLYHVTVALIWRVLPGAHHDVREIGSVEAGSDADLGALRHVAVDPGLMRLGQLMSALAGIATLAIVWWFLRQRDLSEPVRAIGIAMVALSPAMIAINAQTTNDSFAICFGTLTLAVAWRYFATWKPSLLVGLIAAASLAVLSKGHAFVVVLAVLGGFAVALISRADSLPVPRARVLAGLAAFTVAFLAIVGVFGPYRDNWRAGGSPFAVNLETNPPPPLLHAAAPPSCASARQCWRPGTTTVFDTYFRLRAFDLLKHPVMTTQGLVSYPINRTSLWARIYGSAHYSRFEQWPPSWQDQGRSVVWRGRAVLLVAALPTLLLVAGIARATARLVRRVWRRTGAAGELGDAVLTMAVLGFLAFMVKFSYTYRDHSTMKAIIILPCVVGVVWLFADESERLARRLGERSAWLQRSAVGLIGVLLALYVLDISLLIVHLA